MVDVDRQDADRVMIGFAHHGLTVVVTDKSVNIVARRV